MTRRIAIVLALAGCLVLPAAALAQNPHLVVYQGTSGPGAGKHIVFLAGDHEYRSEESLPALARILAKHYGFKCSVFFTTDPASIHFSYRRYLENRLRDAYGFQGTPIRLVFREQVREKRERKRRTRSR